MKKLRLSSRCSNRIQNMNITFIFRRGFTLCGCMKGVTGHRVGLNGIGDWVEMKMK